MAPVISAGRFVASMVRMRASLVGAVGHCIELAGFFGVGHRAGESSPGQGQTIGVIGRDDGRIGELAFAALIDRDHRTDEALLAQIGLGSGDEEIARRDGEQAFGPDAAGQGLEEGRRLAGSFVLVDADERGAFRADEDQPVRAEGRDFGPFRLDALLVALLGIVAEAHGFIFEGGAAFDSRRCRPS